MRTLSPVLSAAVNSQFAGEPILTATIYWSGGTVTYSTENDGIIINASDLQSQVTNGSYSDVASVTLTLCDPANSTGVGSVLQKFRDEYTPNTIVEVYNGYKGIVDTSLIFKGRLTGGATWHEATRSLELSAETLTSTENVVLTRSPLNEAIPLVMGTVRNLHATKVISTQIGTLDGTITQLDNSFQIKDCTLPAGEYELTVESGKYRIRYSGTLSVSGAFSISAKNLVHYTNVELDVDLSGQVNYTRNLVVDQTIRLDKTFCYMDDTFLLDVEDYDWTGQQMAINRCKSHYFQHINFTPTGTPQIASLAEFETDWNFEKLDPQTSFGRFARLSTPTKRLTIAAVAGAPKASWGTYKRATKWEFDPYQSVLKPEEDLRLINVSNWKEHPPEMWMLEHGSSVQVDLKDTFIGCEAPSTILGVRAYRTYYGKRFLADVPTRYFNLTTWNGADAVELIRPLDSYKGENWDDELYLCVEGGGGTNTANQISSLLTKFTDLGVGDLSAVSAALADYPSNFAITDEPEVLELCRQIAWQARCALTLRAGVVGLVYLSTPPPSAMAIDHSNIDEESMQLFHTSWDEVVTKFIAKWRWGYADEDTDSRELIREDNTAQYGTRNGDYDFFIYNNEANVRASMEFWGYRYARVWRKARVSTPMPSLILEPFDGCNFNTGFLGGNLLSVIDSVGQNVETDTITVEMTNASSVGSAPVYDPLYFGTLLGSSEAHGCQIYDYIPHRENDDEIESEEKERADFSIKWDEEEEPGGQNGDFDFELEIPVITYKDVEFPIRFRALIPGTKTPFDPPNTPAYQNLTVTLSSTYATLSDPTLYPFVYLPNQSNGWRVKNGFTLNNVTAEDLPVDFTVDTTDLQVNQAKSNTSTHTLRRVDLIWTVWEDYMSSVMATQDINGVWHVQAGVEYTLQVQLRANGQPVGQAAKLNLTPDPSLQLGALMLQYSSVDPEQQTTVEALTETTPGTYLISGSLIDDLDNEEIGSGSVSIQVGDIQTEKLIVTSNATIVRKDQNFTVTVFVNPTDPSSVSMNQTIYLAGISGSLTNTSVTLTDDGDGTFSGSVITAITGDDIPEVLQIITDVKFDPILNPTTDVGKTLLVKEIMTGMEGIMGAPVSVSCQTTVDGEELVASAIVKVELIAAGTPLIKTEPIALVSPWRELPTPVPPPYED